MRAGAAAARRRSAPCASRAAGRGSGAASPAARSGVGAARARSRRPPGGRRAATRSLELEQRRTAGEVPAGALERRPQLGDLSLRRARPSDPPAAVEDERAGADTAEQREDDRDRGHRAGAAVVASRRGGRRAGRSRARPRSPPWAVGEDRAHLAARAHSPPRRCDSAGAAAGVGSNVTQPIPRKKTSTQEWASKSWTTYEPFGAVGAAGREAGHDPRRDPDHPQHQRHRARELLAVAGSILEQE